MKTIGEWEQFQRDFGSDSWSMQRKDFVFMISSDIYMPYKGYIIGWGREKKFKRVWYLKHKFDKREDAMKYCEWWARRLS